MTKMTGAKATFAVVLFLLGAPSIARQADPPLVRLTDQAWGPTYRLTRDGPERVGEKHFAGWLLLNGARFRNSEFPELRTFLLHRYSELSQRSNSDDEFTQLPGEDFEADPNGQIIAGAAICPAEALCGDHTIVGAVRGFTVKASP